MLQLAGTIPERADLNGSGRDGLEHFNGAITAALCNYPRRNLEYQPFRKSIDCSNFQVAVECPRSDATQQLRAIAVPGLMWHVCCPTGTWDANPLPPSTHAHLSPGFGNQVA